MESKKCRKCKKILPENYKHKLCESCRNKQVAAIKSGAKVAVTTIGSVALFVVTKGKIKPKK